MSPTQSIPLDILMIKQRSEFSQQFKNQNLISDDQIHQKLKSLHMFDIKMGIKKHFIS